MPEPTDARYPFVLLTGRGSSSQWHTQTRTAKSAAAAQAVSVAAVRRDQPGGRARAEARAAGVGDRRVAARQHARACAPDLLVQPGQLFIPMHYADTNQLTFASFDPYSRQPSYKHCAVRVRREAESPSQT